MKRRSFFGALAALCCVPFAKEKTLRTFVSTPMPNSLCKPMNNWTWTCTYDEDLARKKLPYGIDYWIAGE